MLSHIYIFFYCNWKNLWLAPFLPVKVSVVSSTGGSFCWNYATGTFYSIYAGDNVCWNYAGFKVPLQLCRCYFRLQLCCWIFGCNYEGVTIFIVVMQVCKAIISGLHFTTSVNVLPKLKYFEGRDYIRIG